MKPYYEDPWVTLWLGDCLEIDAWLAADALVTDPPYGIAWERHKISRADLAEAKNGRYVKLTRNNSLNDLGIANDRTVVARDLALRMWGSKPAYVFGSLLLAPPDGTRQVAIYGKPLNAGNLTCIGGVRRDVEAIYLLGRHKATGGGRTAIFKTRATRVSGGKPSDRGAGLVQRYGHPHAKPTDVLEDLILLCPPGVIADPFAGSGSTGVAAKALGRKAILVELEERYCEIAARRLAQDVLDFGGVA